jgi:putative salt-induced outer membrane protein YdiY
LDGGKLILATDYAGDIPIDWAVVSSFSASEGLEIGTKAGEILRGKITLKSETEFEIQTEQETLNFQRSQITAFGPIPEPEKTGILDNWSGGFNFGYTLSRGNTDLTNLSFALDPVRETSKDRITTHFSSLHSTEDGNTNGNLWKLKGRYDRFFTENLFVYGHGSWDKDGQADLDYRFKQGGGLGYRLRVADHTDFSVGGGASALQERFTGEGRANEGTADLGFNLTSTILDPMVLTIKTGYSPFFTTSGQHLDFSVGVRIPLFAKLNIGFDLIDHYNTSPAEGKQKNDIRILSTIGWAF